MAGVDVDTFRTLLTPAGQALLAEVHRCAGVESDHALGARLRESHDVDLVAAAVTQNHLRGVAVDRFGTDAGRMYFTHDALRHATGALVADHRARRMRDLGVRRVVDVGCGLGGDLLAFARAGLEVRGIDIDPVSVEIARANLDALGLPGTVEVGDARGVVAAADELVFCDPDHRTPRGRLAGLDALSPTWDLIGSMLTGRAVATVFPGVAHGELPDGVEAEWISAGGEVVDTTLWGRGLTDGGPYRRATLLPGGESIVGGDEDDVPVGDVGRHLIEPHEVVIRAGLTARLATELGGWSPDPQLHWISTDDPVDTPFARVYTVLRELPFRTPKLRIALHDRGIGTLTVKSRGLPIVPDALIAKLRLDGPDAATVVLTRVAGEGRAFLVEETPHR
ncbi:class I SAM-dependent methyltransferase [Williamsia maris]|uniref:Methyltransferase domain-containing protein n=1 Tax=Williamsia maris TaxID=72806 RepID=A0ABT1H9E1_9NOCA|nr:methyltransferase domain-containing protein [Williamsia maris]MCP2174869.1 Methyltransferase domain-containing protein [Williamsia maris]